ncbi:hypothetical protein [Desulforhopalus sp. 52FAK]
MNITSFYIALVALFIFSGCSNNSIDPELAGSWAFENPSNKIKSLTFKGDLLGLNGNTLDIKGGEYKLKFSYTVDTSDVPYKLYTIIYALNSKLKTPYAIYKINGNKMTLCYAEEKQKVLYGKPVGKPKEEFPEYFTKKCVNLKKI